MKTAFRAVTMMSAVSIALLLGSCSKDKDPTPSDLIVGNWQVSAINVTTTVGSQSLVQYFISQGMSASEAQELADLIQGDYGDPEGNIDIKAGGTYSSTSDGTTDTGTWELSSDGKTLSIDKGTPDAIVFTIDTLTSTSLVMSYEESETDGGVTFTTHLEFTFTK